MRKFEGISELTGDLFDRHVQALDVLENGVVINKDLSIGMAISLRCPYTPTLGPEGCSGIWNSMRSFLDALPENYDIQVLWKQHNRLKEFRGKLAETPYSPGLIGDVQREIHDNITSLFEEGELRWIEVYFVLVRKCALSDNELRARSRKARALALSDQNQKSGWWSKLLSKISVATDYAYYMERELEEAQTELRSYVDNFKSVADGNNLHPKIQDRAEVLRLFYQHWNHRSYSNGGLPTDSRIDAGQSLHQLFILSPFCWSPRGHGLPVGVFEQDGLYHEILSLYEPKEDYFFPKFSDLLLTDGITNIELTLNAEHGKRLGRIKRLKTVLKQREGIGEDDYEKAATDQVRNELAEMGANSMTTWRASCFFHIWADSLEKLRETVLKVIQLAESHEFRLIEERHAALEYWRASQPFWTQDHDRYRMLDYNSLQLAAILPLCGQPTNIEPNLKIGAIYQTASRSVFNLLFPDPERMNNLNHLTTGGSRSGKSVIEQDKQIQMRRHKSKAVIIDFGNSFKALATVFGTKPIEYDVNTIANRINPFALPKGVSPEPSVVKAKALWLEMLVKDVSEPTNIDDRDLLEDVVQATYKQHAGREIFLHDVRDLLDNRPAKRSALFVNRINAWCHDRGTESKKYLFDGTSQISLDNDLTVLEMKSVREKVKDEQMMAIIFSSLLQAVTNLSYEKADAPKFLIFDEAGSLFEIGNMLEQVEVAFRTMAKNGVYVSGLSQSLGDFAKTKEMAAAIVANTGQTLFLRDFSDTNRRAAAIAKGLNSWEEGIYGSLQTISGSHAEILLVQDVAAGRETTHLVSASTPLKYALTTSEKREKEVIEGYVLSGSTLPDAIRRFAREYPAGLKS